MTEKVKLAGGLEKTVTWIWLEDEQLKVELYDFSETAQRMFGNDIAHTLSVAEQGMKKLYFSADKDKDTLLDWVSKTFRSYFGIKHWLDENGIEYVVDIESWA